MNAFEELDFLLCAKEEPQCFRSKAVTSWEMSVETFTAAQGREDKVQS